MPEVCLPCRASSIMKTSSVTLIASNLAQVTRMMTRPCRTCSPSAAIRAMTQPARTDAGVGRRTLPSLVGRMQGLSTAGLCLVLAVCGGLFQAEGALAAPLSVETSQTATVSSASTETSPLGAALVSSKRVPFDLWNDQLVGPWLSRVVGGATSTMIAWNAVTGRQQRVTFPDCPSRPKFRLITSSFGGEVVGSRLIAHQTCAYRIGSATGPEVFKLRVSSYDLEKKRFSWSKTRPVAADSSSIQAADEEWLVVANGDGAFGATTDLLTVNLRTGNPGRLTLRGVLDPFVAVQDGVLAANTPGEPIEGWDIEDARQLWTLSEPGYPEELPTSYFNVYLGLKGLIVIDKWYGIESLVVDPRSGTIIEDRLPPFSMIDLFDEVAASDSEVVDMRNWSVLGSVPGADIQAVCAGHIWDSSGNVYSVDSGEIVATDETIIPSECLSLTEAAYIIERGTSAWVDVYEFSRP